MTTTLKTLALIALAAFALLLVAGNIALLASGNVWLLPLVAWNVYLAFKVGGQMVWVLNRQTM